VNVAIPQRRGREPAALGPGPFDFSGLVALVGGALQPGRELEDPKELAQQIARQSIRPLVNTLLSVIVANMKATIKNVSPFLKVQEQTLLTDSISNGLKTLQAQFNSDYNNSVVVLEQIFNVDLSNLKIHEVPKQEQTVETTESTESSVEAETVVVEK